MAPEKFKLSHVQKLMCEMKNDAGEMFYRPGRFLKSGVFFCWSESIAYPKSGIRLCGL